MLWFWVVVLVALIGAIAVVAAGRGDSMAEVYDDRPDVNLPTGRALTADDLRSLRLNTGVRGYRMDEVDALLRRLEAELIEREGDQVRVVSPPVGPVGQAPPVMAEAAPAEQADAEPAEPEPVEAGRDEVTDGEPPQILDGEPGESRPRPGEA